MTNKSNLILYYNFGSETIDLGKNSYNIKNVIDYANIYNGTLSNPLCINSKNSYLGEACFLCMKDLMTPEDQFGTFTIPSVSITNGTSIFFWLNILKTVGTTDFMKIVTFDINSNNYVLCHDDNYIYVKVNSFLPIVIGRFVINQPILLYILINKSVKIQVVNESKLSAYNSINVNQNLPNNNLTYTNIIFGDTNKNTCAYIAINEIRVYDSIKSDLVNDNNSIKPTSNFITNLKIDTSTLPQGTLDKSIPFDITFINGTFNRLPLISEINLLYYTKDPNKVTKYNYFKNSINSISVLKPSLGNNNSYSNDMFQKIIYVPSDNNIININTTVKGIKIIDVINLDENIISKLDLGEDGVKNSYNLIELSDNSMYSSLVSTTMETTPVFINDFLTGNKGTTVSFNGIINGIKSKKVYNIYTYKFDDSPNIYYFLDYTLFNKLDSCSSTNLGLSDSGIYTIGVEIISPIYLTQTIYLPKTILLANLQKALKITGVTSNPLLTQVKDTIQVAANDYGIIKLEQESKVTGVNVDTKITVTKDDGTINNLEFTVDNNLFIFTPPVDNNGKTTLGTYTVQAKRTAEGYNTVVSNFLKIIVYDGKQDSIVLTADPVCIYPNNINLKVTATNIKSVTNLYYKYGKDTTYSSTRIYSNVFPFKPTKLGLYSFYVDRTLINFQDISSNIVNVNVTEGNQDPITFDLFNSGKSNYTYNDNVGICVNQTSRMNSSQTIIEINYTDSKTGWQQLFNFNNLPSSQNNVPSSYYYFKLNNTGDATIRLTNISNLYSNFILTKNINILKLDQPPLTLEYTIGNKFIKTQSQRALIESFYAENIKYPVASNTISFDYDSEINLLLGNITFESDIIFTIDNNNIAPVFKIPNMYIYGVNAGKTMLIITKKGNFMYNDLIIKLQINVNKIKQPNTKITLDSGNVIRNIYALNVDRNKAFNLSVGQFFENPAVTYIATNSDSPICKIVGNKLTAYNAGTCQVTGVLSETNNYLETQTVPIVITVNRNQQNDLIYQGDSSLVFGNKLSLNVNGGSTTNDLVYTTTTPDNCTLTNINTVKPKQAGICTVTALRPGDSFYNDTKNLNLNLQIIKANQGPSFITIDGQQKSNNPRYDFSLLLNTQYTLILNGITDKPTGITFVPSDNTVCSISGNILSTLKSGACNITALIPETNNYNSSSSQSLNIFVAKNDQRPISIGSLPVVYVGDSFNLTISGGSINKPSILTSDTSNNCVVQNNNILTTNAGNCSITSTIDGNDYYNPLVTKGINIPINKKYQQNLNVVIQGSQVDSSNNITLPINKNQAYTVQPTNVFENAKVSYQIVNINALNPDIGVCQIKGNQITTLGVGTCNLLINTSETNNYLASVSNPININVVKTYQNDINFGQLPSLNFNNTVALNITGASGTNRTYLNTDSSNCKIKGFNITGMNAGYCNITAMNDGDDSYLPKSNKTSINVNKISQPNIKLLVNDSLNNNYQDNNGNCILKVDRNKTYILSLSGYVENPKINYSIVTNFSQNRDPVCTLSGNLLTAYSEGICLIEADYSETANYISGKTKVTNITVMKTEQSDFMLGTTPTFYYNNPTFIDISGGSSSYPINFNSLTSNTCSVSGQVIFANEVGDCNVTATKQGGYYYYDKIKNYNFKIVQEYQPPINILINGLKPDFTTPITLPTVFTNNNLVIDSETEVNSFKNGKYIVSASSIGARGNDAYNVFRNQKVTGWTSGNPNTGFSNYSYEQNTGNYIGGGYGYLFNTGIVGGTVIYGEWVQIKLPYDINITSYNLLSYFPNSQSKCPQMFSVAGSKDGYTWYLIDSQNIQTFPDERSPLNFNVTSDNTFNYFRLIISKLRGGDNNSINVNLLQWNILGIYSNNTYTLTVDKTTQYKLNLTNVQDKATYKFNATSNYSMDPLEPVVKLNDNQLIAYHAGVCTIQASINSTNRYLPALSNTIIIQVKAIETVLTSGPINPLYYNSNVKVDISGGSGLPITFTSDNPDNCTTSGSTIFGIKAGKCNVRVNQQGNDQYKAPPELPLSLSVLKIKQPKFHLMYDDNIMDLTDNVTFNVNRNKTYILSISGLAENPNITYNITTNYSLDPNEPVVKLNKNQLIAYNAGVCLVQAEINETINYRAVKSDPIVITVLKNQQNPLNYNVNSLIYSEHSTINVSGGSNKNNIVLNVDPKSQKNCSVTNTQNYVSNEVNYGTYDLAGLYTGNCKLSANKSGDFNYDDIQMNIPLVVNKENQRDLSISLNLEPLSSISPYRNSSNAAPF
jgi:hypothetical protein